MACARYQDEPNARDFDFEGDMSLKKRTPQKGGASGGAIAPILLIDLERVDDSFICSLSKCDVWVKEDRLL